MKNYFKNILAQLAQLAFSFVKYCISISNTVYVNGTNLAQLALSKIVCATYAKLVPLKNVLKPLLILDCANCATYATQYLRK